jgi:TatD DNase family protein
MSLCFFDSHVHLDAPQFADDQQEVLARARAAGVEVLLTIGTGVESSRRALALAAAHPDVHAAVGIDPHGATACSEEALAELERLAREPRVVAIGETGLDYHYYYSPEEDQRRSFRAHIRLARRCRLPLIIHNRKADADVLAILDEEGAWEGCPAVVLHCFDAGPQVATEVLERGGLLSFSGMVTFKKREDLREIARTVPRDRLLVETDAPYLAPVPHRGRRNEPAFVVRTFELLARIRGEPLEELVPALRENLRRVFGI